MPEKKLSRQTIGKIDAGEKPKVMYLLLDASVNDIREYDEKGRKELPGDTLRAVACYCPQCEKLVPMESFEIEKEAFKPLYYGVTDKSWPVKYNLAQFGMPDQIKADCPDCEAGMSVGFIAMDAEHRTWETPPILVDKEVYRLDDPETGKAQRIMDSTVLSSAVITSDMEVDATRETVTEVLDLEHRDMYMNIHAGKPGAQVLTDAQKLASALKYSYKTASFQPRQLYGMDKPVDPPMLFGIGRSPLAKTKSQCSTYLQADGDTSRRNFPSYVAPCTDTNVASYVVPKDGYVHQDHALFGLDESKEGMNLYKGIEVLQKKMNLEKLKALGLSMRTEDPVFSDILGTKVLEDSPSVHPATDVSTMKSTHAVQLADLMVRYPVAFDYIVERAEKAIENYDYGRKRLQAERAEAGIHYELKPIDDSVKAKLFRQECLHVVKQMQYADDAILEEIRRAKDVDDMKSHLAFYVFGKTEDTMMPRAVKVPADGPRRSAAQSTKSIKQLFRDEPIATASNFRTFHKLGITKPDHVNTLLERSRKYMTDEPARTRNAGEILYDDGSSLPYVKAGVISPIRKGSAMSFITRYGRTHSQTNMLDAFYTSTDEHPNDPMAGFNLLTETISLYDTVTRSAVIVDGDDNRGKFERSSQKRHLRNFLKQRDIQAAYLEFVDVYHEKTFEKVNELVDEIRQDIADEKFVRFFDEHGLDTTMENFPERFEGASDFQAVVDGVRERVKLNNTLFVTTRNDKDLFQNRTLREIHDELSIMSEKTIGENVPISYPEKTLKLEAKYPKPGEPEGTDKTYGFHLMHESHDFVRTATDLHNCVAGGTYLESVQKGRSAILYMTDENERKVACIELHPLNGGGKTQWTCMQFQGDHDSALPAEFSDTAIRWMDEHGIAYKDCHDVKRFGTGQYIHGNGNDYHLEEVDEPTGARVTPKERRRLAEERAREAMSIYGTGPDGQVLVPKVPDDLADIDFN